MHKTKFSTTSCFKSSKSQHKIYFLHNLSVQKIIKNVESVNEFSSLSDCIPYTFTDAQKMEKTKEENIFCLVFQSRGDGFNYTIYNFFLLPNLFNFVCCPVLLNFRGKWYLFFRSYEFPCFIGKITENKQKKSFRNPLGTVILVDV